MSSTRPTAPPGSTRQHSRPPAALRLALHAQQRRDAAGVHEVEAAQVEHQALGTPDGADAALERRRGRHVELAAQDQPGHAAPLHRPLDLEHLGLLHIGVRCSLRQIGAPPAARFA